MNYAGLTEGAQLKKARKEYESKVTIYTEMGMTPPRRDAATIESWGKSSIRISLKRQLYLTKLSKSTGGWISMLEEEEQAGEVYKTILAEINRRYVIGYYPTNEMRDGKRRTIKIQVREHPEYRIQGRKTYYAARVKKD